MQTSHKQQIQSLSDKDIQLLRKTYCRLTELFYENSQNDSVVKDLIHLSDLITQVIATPREANVLALLPIIQPLKIKAKSRPQLLSHIDSIVKHLKMPSYQSIKYDNLLYGLQNNGLFTISCTIAIRFYEKIQAECGDVNWKQIIQQLARNIAISPALSVELSYLICRDNETFSKAAVKSGLLKYVFLSYISSTLDNRYTLYKAIKLLKVIAIAQGTILREKQKGLALVLYTYDDYVPVIEGIISKCYESQYCQAIDRRGKYDQNTIDQPYLWSYLQTFCQNNLSQQTIKYFIGWLNRPLNQVEQKKIYGILSNYSKFKKVVLKPVLQILPKSQNALLNYIKLCVNCCQLDHNSSSFIDMNQLEALVDKSTNSKVINLFKYLRELKNKEHKIGVLSDNYKKMFDMEKNAEFMMERAAKVPQNNQQLTDIQQIVKEKDRMNEFQSDTLKMVKEKALDSLHLAVMQKKKLDLNPILKNVDLSDVRFLARLLQILELCLTINEDMIESIDVKVVLDIILWIEQNYRGQLIDWGSISQLLAILTDENQWKNHLNQLSNKAFWLLRIQQVDDQKIIWNAFSNINVESFPEKIPLLVGFASRALSVESRLSLSNYFPQWFSLLTENLKNCSGLQYKKTLVMWSYFIKNWHSQNTTLNQSFNDIIEYVIKIVLSNFRGLEQQYELLESCLPYKINCGGLIENVDFLISLYGRLASYIYREWNGDKIHVNYEKIKALGRLPVENNKNILEILNFLQQNSQLFQHNELSVLITNLHNNEYVYWFLYPNFYSILNRIISILTNTNNQIIINNITNLLYQIIILVSTNIDASEEQRQDLFNEIKQCLIRISKQGLRIDKQRLKRAAQKIPEKRIRQQIIQILDGYQPKEENLQNSLPKTESDIVSDSTYRSTSILQPPSNEANRQSILDASKSQIISPEELIIQHLDFTEAQKIQGDLSVLQALRILKKIIEEKQPQSNFPTLYNIFMNNILQSEYIDILGHLLSAFYPNRPKQMQQMCIEMLMNKSKTRLSRQACFKLLSQYPQTFILSRRWKLKGRDWLDLAMLRINQGYITDGSQVAEHNIGSTTELQHFLQKNYHSLVISAFDKAVGQDEFVNLVVLIGTSARHPQIKGIYYRQNIHVRLLKLIHSFISNTKFFANLLYALSSLVYTQQEVCADLIKCPNQIKMILNELKNKVQNKEIVESGACLIANLSYSNQQVKETLRQLQVIPIMAYIFEVILPVGQTATFKQIIRAFGNLSLSVKCSKQLIDHHFCSLAVRMANSIDMFVNFEEQKAPLIKITLELIVNLSSHRYKLDVFHTQGISEILLIILENVDTQIPILTACIDTIDCLCQNPEIENYMVCQRKIPFLLIDILKIQTDEKIVVKATRLLTNLTINPGCIPHLLKANLLSVMANIVMPHFYGNKMAAQQHKKMQTYILKIISRVYHSKPDKDTLLKSGYLDCLVRTVETNENVEDTYVDLLYFYADIMPSFLNKRAFICLIRILGNRIGSKDIITKCLRAIKKLSVVYEDDQQDFLLPGTVQIYEKLLSSEFKTESLELLVNHLFRSSLLRQQLSITKAKILQILKKLSDNSAYLQICKQIFFLIYNPMTKWGESHPTDTLKQLQTLKDGFRCKLYRIDGSCKKAMVDMTVDYQLRAYKYPDGQIKNKYVIDIKNIKDCQFNYPLLDSLWNSTVFPHEKGIFDSSKCEPKNCCTLISSKKWGLISYINLEFDNVADKEKFQFCVRTIYNSLR